MGKILFAVMMFFFVAIITSAEPVIISTQIDLENINNNLSGNYILANDICLTGTYTHAVIASNTIAFTGTFDGAGFVIRNLNINSSGSSIGLFGSIGNGGSVSRLGIQNAIINADANVGVLAGVADQNTSIADCYSTGTVIATGNYAGGLVGKAACSITKSYSLASVTGVDFVGGIAGYNVIPDLISQTYSTGQITGTGSNVGGLFGKSSLSERSAVRFNGSSDYLTLSQPLPIFNSSFTIEMWVYFNDDERGVLLGDYELSGGLKTNFEKNTNGGLRIYWNNGDLDLKTNLNVVAIQKWNHIVFQRDKASNEFRVFVNGIVVNTFTGIGVDLTATVPHYLGRDNRSGDTAPCFNGKMRDVRIWNYVRTPSQVRSDMFGQLTGTETGLVLYLKFDEGSGNIVNDNSSSNNDAYFPTVIPDCTSSENHGIVNGAIFESIPAKYFSNAIAFNGDSDCVALSNPLAIFNSSFTIEMWAYFNDGGRDILLGDYGLSGSIQTNFEKYSSKNLRIFWNNGASTPGGVHFVTSANVVNINTWHHIVFQRDKTANVFRIYVDGNLVGSSTSAGGDLTPTIPHYLGRDSRTGSTALNGKLADVRIWNYVRTQAEIQADMNYLLTGNEPGLINYWKFNPNEIIMGLNWDTTTLMADSVWDVNTSHQQTSSGGVGKVTVQMLDVNTFKPMSWDFNDVWHFLSEGYPILNWQAKKADLNNNGEVNFCDLAILASDWSEQSAVSNCTIYNPYENIDWNTFGQYKANLHTHTNQSDGADSPSAVIDAYRSYGYTILSITDHDTKGDAQPTWPWTDYGREPAAFGMIAVKGNEVSKGHHTLSYFCDYGNGSESLTENAINTIGAEGGLAVIAHPVYKNHYGGSLGLPAGMQWTAQVYADLFNEYNHLIGMEVYNRVTNLDAHRPVWDAVLALTMPEKNIWGFSNDDAHSGGSRSFALDVFLLPEFTEQAVRNSMETGAFYFAYSLVQNAATPIINSIYVDYSLGRITITASNYSTIVWISEGVQVGSGETFNIKDEFVDKYVRAEIIGSTGVAFTQPFGIENPCADIYRQGLNCPGDINRDCSVDFYDIVIFAGQWLQRVWE